MDSNLIKNELNYLPKMKQKTSKTYIKNLMPRSGSYDINNQPPDYDDSSSLYFNENVALNSVAECKDDPFQSSNNLMKLFTDIKATKPENDTKNSFSKLQSKCLGMPLLYLAYFSAFYTLLAYGATSLFSIYYIISNKFTNLIPLYVCLVGYITVTIMSFLLILAIKRDRINVITIWIITVAVMILPEIGLNIVLLEASSDWSYNDYQIIVVTLTIRILLDLPCLMLVLCYHAHKIKRNNYLQDMLQPLKNNIVNGEVLKIYNNIKVDEFEKPGSVVQISEQPATVNSSVKNNNNMERPNRYIFNHNMNHPIYLRKCKEELTPEMKSQPFKSIKNYDKEEALMENNEYSMDGLHLVYGKPELDEIDLIDESIEKNDSEKSLENCEILMHHHNIDINLPVTKAESAELLISVENHRRPEGVSSPIFSDSNKLNSTASLDKLMHTPINESFRNFTRIQQELTQLPGVKKNPIYGSVLPTEREPRVSLLKRSTSLNCKIGYERDVNIPIEYEGPIIRLLIKNNEPVSFQQYPLIKKKINPDENIIRYNGQNNKSQIINLANHHIYLPPTPTMIGKLEENSTLIEKSVTISENN